jgi:predicted RNA-binding protein with PIN domain
MRMEHEDFGKEIEKSRKNVKQKQTKVHKKTPNTNNNNKPC